MATELFDHELAHVTGGGAWDAVDRGIAKVAPQWNDMSCVARAPYVGWGIGTTFGTAMWATFPYVGAWGPAVLGPVTGLAHTALMSSYQQNCERQKAGSEGASAPR